VEPRPHIVWAFVAYNAISLVGWFLIWGFPSFDSAGSWTAVIVTGALVALALYGFVRGVRLAWWFFVVSFFLAFVPTGQSPGRYWLGAVLSLVALGMLLIPSMRRYFFRRNPGTTPS
jgi:hypothetical protein